MKKLFPLFIFTLILLTCSSDDSGAEQPIGNPGLKVVTTAAITEDLNNLLGVNDIVTFSISAKNIGDVNLSEISLNVSLADLTGNTLILTSGPNFVSSDSGSEFANLQVDETATYSATYVITQSDVNAGGLSFSITTRGTTLDGENVSDVSDNGDDTDGNDSNDPTVTSIEFNPTVIAEFHLLNSDGEPHIKYYFDDAGQLYELYFTSRNPPYTVYIYNFEFDADQKLINLTITDIDGVILESNDVLYDSEGRLASFGERLFEFVEDEPDYFIDHGTLFEDIYTMGDIVYTESYYNKLYYSSPDNPILRGCSYSYNSEYNAVTEELTESGGCGDMWWYPYNGNVNGQCSDTDCTNFGHDSNINPLYSTTNLIDIYGFGVIGGLSFTDYDIFYALISQNNVSGITYSDPSYIEFEYLFNDNNLPVSSTRQYTDELGPGTIYACSNYYYQGDAIPE